MAKMKKPTHRDPARKHRKYGIRSWLENKLNVTAWQEQDEYIRTFCKESGFIEPNKGDIMLIREAFISNKRFPLFATWARKFHKTRSPTSGSNSL